MGNILFQARCPKRICIESSRTSRLFQGEGRRTRPSRTARSQPVGDSRSPSATAARSPRGLPFTALYARGLSTSRRGASRSGLSRRAPSPLGSLGRLSRGLPSPAPPAPRPSRPSTPLTQKMRLRNTSTVLEEVMPHWPMVPAPRWGPARRAGCAHRARRQWRRRLSAGSCTACAALTAAPSAVAQPRPQQAPRFFAQPPQIPGLPEQLPGNRVPPPAV